MRVGERRGGTLVDGSICDFIIGYMSCDIPVSATPVYITLQAHLLRHAQGLRENWHPIVAGKSKACFPCFHFYIISPSCSQTPACLTNGVRSFLGRMEDDYVFPFEYERQACSVVSRVQA